MKRICLAIALVAALAGLPMIASAQQALGPGTIEGTLENSTASYALEAAAGDAFLISASSDDFDTLLTVFDSEGITVAADDDGGYGSNSRLVFVAPAAGTYTVTVEPFSGSGAGDFSVDVIADVTSVTAGTSVTVDLDGATPVLFAFETAGGAYNVFAGSADGEVAVNLDIVASLGYSIDSVEAHSSAEPAFAPVVLTADLYHIVLAPFDEESVGEVTFLIEEAELVELGSAPAVLAFGDGTDESIAAFTVEEGRTYEITVELSRRGEFSAYLEADNPDLFSYGYFSFSAGLGGSYLYSADITGMILVTISAGYSSEPIETTITVTPVEE